MEPGNNENKPIAGEQMDLFPADQVPEKPGEERESGFESANAEQQDLFEWAPKQTPGQRLDSAIGLAKAKWGGIKGKFTSFWNRTADRVNEVGDSIDNAVNAGADRLQEADDWIGGQLEAAKNGAAKFFESNFTAEGRLKKFAEKLGLREENIPTLDSPEARSSILGLNEEDGLAMGEVIAGKGMFGAIQRYRQRIEDIKSRFAAQQESDAGEAETQRSLEKAAAMNAMAGQIEVAKKIGYLKASSWEHALQMLDYGEKLGLIDRNEIKLEIDRRQPQAESPEQALRQAA